jgi:hypothetical protein
VAKLAGLRLLRAAPAWPPPSLRVICFATPAVGNNALARLVEQAGWGGFFKTYVMPGGCGVTEFILGGGEAGTCQRLRGWVLQVDTVTAERYSPCWWSKLAGAAANVSRSVVHKELGSTQKGGGEHKRQASMMGGVRYM